jgi:hypothetical protein
VRYSRRKKLTGKYREVQQKEETDGKVQGGTAEGRNGQEII